MSPAVMVGVPGEHFFLATVLHDLATSQQNFCNEFYRGLPLDTVQKLHLVQNAAARCPAGSADIFPIYANCLLTS